MILATLGQTPALATQDGDDRFLLGAITAICPDEEIVAVYANCTPWEDVTVSFVSGDETINETCVTDLAAPNNPWASCGIEVPFGGTITVMIDESQIPDGYYLFGEPTQEWPIPDGPPEGEIGAPSFIIIPDGDQDGGEDSGNGNDTADEDGDVADLPSTGTGALAGTGKADTKLAIMASLLLLVGAMLRRSSFRP